MGFDHWKGARFGGLKAKGWGEGISKGKGLGTFVSALIKL